MSCFANVKLIYSLIFVLPMIAGPNYGIGQSGVKLIGVEDANKHVNDSVSLYGWVKNVKTIGKTGVTKIIIFDKFKNVVSVGLIISNEILNKPWNIKPNKMIGNCLIARGLLIMENGELIIHIKDVNCISNLSRWEPPPTDDRKVFDQIAGSYAGGLDTKKNTSYPIDLRGVANYVGDSVRVCAPIINIKRTNEEVQVTVCDLTHVGKEVLVIISKEILLKTKHKDDLNNNDQLCVDGVLLKRRKAFSINVIKPEQFQIVRIEDLKFGGE